MHFHVVALSTGTGLRPPDEALHEFGGLAVLGLLEVGVGSQSHVAIRMAGLAGNGAPVHTSTDRSWILGAWIFR